MRKAFILFCLFSIAFSGNCFAQISANDSTSGLIPFKNSVYAELGGNGIMGSVNYERLIPFSESFTMALRVGGLYLPDGKKNYGYMLPAEMSLIIGAKPRKFEAGFGYTYLRYEDLEYGYYDGVSSSSVTLVPVLRIGARRQLLNNRLLLRSGFNFLFVESVTLGSFPIPWLGISAGYYFGKK